MMSNYGTELAQPFTLVRSVDGREFDPLLAR